MFSFLRREEPRQTGIKLIKVYDDIDMPVEVISGPTKDTDKLLDDIIANPKRYAWHVKVKDELLNAPRIKIDILNEPEPIPNTNIFVIAEVTYLYTTHIEPPRANPVLSFLWLLLVTSILGGGIIYLLNYNSARAFDIENQCYMYTKEGKPNFVQVDGVKYHFNSDGTMRYEDGIFLNPWHREVLESGQCVHVDTE